MAALFSKVINWGTPLAILVWALASSCVVEPGAKTKANCDEGASFDVLSRSCAQTATTYHSPPIPTGTGGDVSTDEDSGAFPVDLGYRDIDGDLASGCEARSQMGLGIRKFVELSSIRFLSRGNILDPHNTYIRLNPTGAVPVAVIPSVGLVGSNAARRIDIAYSATVHGQSDIILAVQNNAIANGLVEVTSVGVDALASSAGYHNLTALPCSCSGGLCQARITPVDNFPAKSADNINLNNMLSTYNLWPSLPGGQAMGEVGFSDFEYRVSDNDGASDWRPADIRVHQVNDPPNVMGVLAAYNIAEPQDADATFTYDLANMAGLTFEEIEEEQIHFCTVSQGSLGASSLDIQTGVLQYRVARDDNGTDTVVFRACDSNSCQGSGCTLDQTLNISVGPTADPFRGGDLSSDRGITLPAFDEDEESGATTDIINNLFFEDTDGGETAVGCQFDLSESIGVYASTDCTCTGGVCSIGITGKAHYSGPNARIAYRVISNDPVDPVGDLTFYTVAIDSVDDPPVALGTLEAGTTPTALYQDGNSQNAGLSGRLRFNESSSHLPPQVNFTIAEAFLADAGEGDTVVAYELDDGPDNGVLSDCMGLDGSAVTDRECVYTPQDGNLNDGGALMDDNTDKGWVDNASASLRFIAREFGDSSSSLQVEMIDAQEVGGGDEEVWVDGNTVKILYEAGVSTSNDIVTAFAATSVAAIEELVQVQALMAATLPAADEQIYTLSAGTATADRFAYRVRDSDGILSASKNVHISIVPVDDRPVVCEYSSYQEQPNCGLNGCTGDGAPTSLTGISEGASYYDRLSSACWRYLSGNWALARSFIRDRSVNELQTVLIDRIVVDEGGGDPAENGQSTRLVGITSSNLDLLPVENIHLLYSGSATCDTLADNCHGGSLATPIAFETTGNAQDADLSLSITPVVAQTGTSRIELTFDDGTLETEVEFEITVNPTSATHGGWNLLSATGPKVDTYGHVAEARNHCPYSLDLCEEGTACRGPDSPLGAVEWTPDDVNAVYLQEGIGDSPDTCFRVRRTPVQHIFYAPRASDYAAVEYVAGATASNETVSVNGEGSAGDPYRIRVEIEDGVSTTDQIIAAIRASTDANALVLALNASPGETQDTQSLVSLGHMGESAWESFTTNCSVTPADFEPACDTYGETCQGFGAPTVTPTVIDARYWDELGNRCYRSMGTTNAGDWIPYDAAAEIRLSWNKFSVSGLGVVGSYQVFRRPANTQFDYQFPINKQIIEGGIGETISFVDNHRNSVFPPIPNTVYYYQIRPVINGILTSTNQTFSTVRIMAPPKNMAFVHRWMANKAICDLLHSTSNPVLNYACPYRGPGDTDLGSNNFVYDVSTDLLVDRFETGCAYAVSPTCSGNPDGTCIGIQAPATAGITAANGAVYYARGSGRCYLRSGGSWNEIYSAANITAYLAAVDNRNLVGTDPQNDETTDIDSNRPLLPPLAHMTQELADDFCTGQNSLPNAEIYGINTDLARRLPNRKEQIAYSQWGDEDHATEAEKAALESGLALHAASKCNSSNASGLEHSYSDIAIPDSNNYYSLPGNHSSNIRSLATGSHQTRACTSQFGVQDAIGNLAEWSSMRISCRGIRGGVTARLSTCSPITTGASHLASDPAALYQSADTTDPFGTWGLDGIRGPCVDRDGDDICDSAITDWKLKEERLGAGRFIIPLGLLSQNDYLLNNPSSQVDLTEIGPSSGITSSQLRDDAVSFHTERIFASSSANDCAGMATGGHYQSGVEAGAFSAEFIPCEGNAFGYLTIQDISFRAINAANSTVGIRYEDNTAVNNVAFTANTLVIDLADLSGRTADDVVTDLNANAIFNARLVAAVSGDPNRNQTAFTNTLNLIDVSAESSPSRIDVGLRCLSAVPNGFYDE